tara:strand:- start:44 stop:442 length:399 start_codon:yes stop_codon:yes gene_type:complete
MIRYIFIIFLSLTSLSYADEYFCEGESNYNIRVSEGELIKEKIQIHKTRKKFKMKINYYKNNISIKYLANTKSQINYNIIRHHNGLFGTRYDKNGLGNSNHSISFNDLINTVTQHFPGLQSTSMIISKCTKL